MARWVGAQGQGTSAKQRKHMPPLCHHRQETPNSNQKIYEKSVLEDFLNS